ncbi:MAG: DUF4340 domain-containing protein [Puniceicoccales bacterium]|jgi:hypothetical protein|nr:DUF4340 domain-containing protein [Puniceicoccales bacterium]
MRWKSTVLLLLANLATFGIFHGILKKPSRAIGTEDRFITVLLKDVEWIEINGPEGEVHRFERRSLRWEMIRPFRWPANAFAIEKLLSQIRFLEKEVSFPIGSLKSSQQTLSDYGLSPPLLTLKLGIGEKELRLKMGQKTTVGNRLYVLNERDGQILAVKRENLNTLLMPKENWCSPSLFQSFPKNIHTIQFKNKLLQVLLVQEGKQWSFKTPIAAPASRAHVELLLEELQDLSVSKFPEIPPDGMAEEDNETHHILLAGEEFNWKATFRALPNPPHTYYGKIEGYDRGFIVETYVIDRLVEAQETLRERRIWPTDSTDIQEITSVNGAEKVQLQRMPDGRWKIFDSHRIPLGYDMADSQKIHRLLETLQLMTVKHFVRDLPTLADLNTFGLGEECSHRLVVKSSSGSNSLLFALKEGHLYAKWADSPSLFELHPSYQHYLQIDFSEYRDKTVWAWHDTEQLRKVEISHYGQVLIRYTSHSAPPQWHCDVGNDPDHRGLDRVLKQARKWEAKNFLMGPIIPRWPLIPTDGGVWPYLMKMETFDGTQVRHYDMLFSERLGASFQLGKYGQTLFTLPQNWIDTLFTLIERPQWDEFSGETP